MNEWKEFLIEDLAEFCNAKRVPLSSMQRQQLQGSYPYYGASGIVDYVNDYIFEGSHVLISEDGENLKSRNTPIAFEASGKFWVNNHAHILKAKEPHLTKILIHYFAQLDLTPYLTGAVQPKLNKATLSKIPLYLPSSTAEQKAIASVLSSLDDKIDLLHRQNKTLEAMAETLFRQWFIEEAKEDWEYVELGSVVETSSGGTPSRKEMSYYENGSIHWVKSKELNGSFITETEEMITDEAVKKSSAKLLPAYSTLIAMYGATVGEYALITKTMTCNQAVCALKENEAYPYTFIFMYVKNQKDELINQAVGSAQQNISQILIKKLPIPTCTARINEYHQLVIPWFKKMQLNVEQIQILEKLRDTLLPKLMSGEVRVQYQTEEVA